MSDHTFGIPTFPWPWRLARSPGGVASGVARTGSVPQRKAGFDRPEFSGVRRPDGLRRPSFRAMLRAAWRRHRTRSCLAELDAHVLKDIGVTYAEAEAEANKPF
jgi:uncharacterized protein YjiS (DUF1127 family)